MRPQGSLILLLKPRNARLEPSPSTEIVYMDVDEPDISLATMIWLLLPRNGSSANVVHRFRSKSVHGAHIFPSNNVFEAHSDICCFLGKSRAS